MRIVSLKDCSYEDALSCWNASFQDYPVNIQMEWDSFMKMMVSKRLPPSLSFMAFEDHRPVGIILNGIQEIDGVKTAYNGGTAVHPSYRKRGVGRLLVHSSLAMYEKEEVEEARLEAIADNRSAIALYESYGYVVIDHLHIMKAAGGKSAGLSRFRLEPVDEQVWNEGARREKYPWQNQPFAVDQGTYYSVLEGQTIIGGLLVSRNQKGDILLFQMQTENKGKECLTALCNEFSFSVITAFNIPQKSAAYQALHQEGFKTVLKQVWMKKGWD